MANKLYKEEVIQDIADATKELIGDDTKMVIAEIPPKIRSAIGSGGGEIKLQDKAFTDNGVYTADSGFDGFGTVTVDVEKGLPVGSLSGLENGHDITFYDENNFGIAFYSIKKGHTIQGPPVYVCDYWTYSDGVPVVFPITPTEDMSVYAYFADLVSDLYEFYKIDSVLYPYLAVHVTQSSVPKDTIIIYFGKTLSDESNAIFLYEAMWGYNSKLSSELENIDLNDMNAVVSLAMNKIPSLEQTPLSSIVPQQALYTNFSHSKTATEVTSRLDR